MSEVRAAVVGHVAAFDAIAHRRRHPRRFSIAAFLTVTGSLITRRKVYREGSADL